MSDGRALWLPTPRQLLLLRACLWDGERALEAWAEWRRRLPSGLEEIDRGSQRLLPLLYANLGPRLGGDPDGELLKGAYRRSWAVNQLALRIAGEAIEALRAAGVEALALKGAALIGSAYRDAGARPLGDADLAVRPERIGIAVEALREAGFAPVADDPRRRLAVHHSLAFRHPEGQEVDLHREVLWRPGLGEACWEGSVEAEVAGHRARVPDPADHLALVCVHGAAWNAAPPIRWAADACKIVESAEGGLDWERLVRTAEAAHLTLPLRETLAYLAEQLQAPVPESARRALATVPVGAGERRAHEALARPPSPRRSLAMLWWFWERYRAGAALGGERPSPGGLLRYLRDFWGLRRTAQVPAHALRRLLR